MEVKEYESPAGVLLLAEENGRLSLCDWRDGKHNVCHMSVNPVSLFISEAIRQLDEYFSGVRKVFTMPLIHHGTDFQLRVWEELQALPYGTTISYKILAERIGYPKAVRAVANAIGRNSLSIFCPCHRVIGNDGSIGGYAGGIEAKKILLNLENQL